MTKVIKYICNKCNEEIKGEVFKVHIDIVSFLSWNNHYHCDGIKLTEPSEYNLCATCVRKVKQYLNYD